MIALRRSLRALTRSRLCRIILPLILTLAKYVPLVAYCSRLGIFGNDRQFPFLERREFFRELPFWVCSWAACICRRNYAGYKSGIQFKNWLAFLVRKCLVYMVLVEYPSGQRGQTVNLLAYAFAGSNPASTTILTTKGKGWF
jgi:hypothetical protein